MHILNLLAHRCAYTIEMCCKDAAQRVLFYNSCNLLRSAAEDSLRVMQRKSQQKQMKKYELWRSETGHLDAFFASDNDSARKALPLNAKLVWTVEAHSWNEAQQKRYDLMRWGHYRTIEEDENS